ncbi:hypothetical protein [Streptomyces brasiliensis]|uniref:Uncharacterized protein n=1 Tax=Streptomyces brasiliensis TaxID=1954 RepID=A0A917LAK4_9ACTN|nr:hypothetical protein [Streptomyces brasiliensis]GGJ52091.1 hypothetical protein GCM10010121_073720 [Streptomyces brasiliensis]
MSNLSKVTTWADILHDLMGLAAGAMLLALGLTTHRHGGSVGWVIAGAAALISTSLWVARRRHVRRRKTTPSP